MIAKDMKELREKIKSRMEQAEKNKQGWIEGSGFLGYSSDYYEGVRVALKIVLADLKDYKISTEKYVHKSKCVHGIRSPITKEKPKQENGVYFDFWPCMRPMTRTWGSGNVFDRITKHLGKPNVAFGKTDGIPDDVVTVDRDQETNPTHCEEWIDLPFEDNTFEFGYWDPPYDHLYKKEGQEIWRTVKQLAVLHPTVYCTSWFKDARRVGMIAVTMGPLKQMRCLQVFQKDFNGE